MPDPDPLLPLLLDPVRLGDLVGRPVRATRLRPKPGVSHVAALLDDHGNAVGWLQGLLGDARVKAGKTLDRAGRLGLAEAVGVRELPDQDATVLWGPVAADPALGRSLARAGLVDTSGTGLLRHNPLRRVVLRTGGHVVRVTAQPHRDRLTSVATTLAEAGAAVVRPLPRGALDRGADRPTTSWWPWVDGHDLAHAASPDQLREVGRLVAGLHGIPPGLLAGLPRDGWAQRRAAASRAVRQLAEVAPEVAGGARRALAALPAHLPSDRREVVLLHGDLSLDQVLAGPDGRLLLTDLDRVAAGPPEIDLASVRAVALVDGVDVAPLLQGYAAAHRGRPVTDLGAWVAAALLARVSEPWRAQAPGWAAETRRRVALAAQAGQAQAGQAQAAPARSRAGSAPSRATPWRVPAAVTDADGTVVEVARAWPDREADGVARVAVEGRDGRGRLRAGTVDRAGRVRLLPPGQDPRLPGLAPRADEGELVVHRAGRRAVLACPDGYAKLLRPGRAAAVAHAAETGRGVVAGAGLRAPRVLDVDDGAVLLETMAGRPVHGLADDESWPAVWSAWGRAWAALQAGGADVPLPSHTPEDEAAVLTRWRDRCAAAGVLHGTGWLDRLTATADDLTALSPTRLVPTHRDLHDQQLLWDGRSLAVLDLDTACLAEPALDLANLAVHTRLRQAQGLWTPGATRVALSAVGRVADAAGAGPARMDVAERATLARLVAVYAFRPRWRTAVLAWADEAWPRLTDGSRRGW